MKARPKPKKISFIKLTSNNQIKNYIKSYNTTIKNYTTVVKQLNDMLPTDDRKPNNDGFDEFGDT